MIHDQERLRHIRANAQLVVEKLDPERSRKDAVYDESSVQWLEGFIERQRARALKPDYVETLSNVLGCFLGECIIYTYGGHWSDHDKYGLCVVIKEGIAAFPLEKVRKQFEKGLDEGESIHGFFTAIPLAFSLKEPPPS